MKFQAKRMDGKARLTIPAIYVQKLLKQNVIAQVSLKHLLEENGGMEENRCVE